MQILAAVARTHRAPFVLETLELAAPRADEILVKVVATGICHTDIVVRDGVMPTPLPVVLGHEGSGVVEAVGANITSVEPGDHVVMSFDSCGVCASCRDHAVAYCHEHFQRNFLAARADGSSPISKDGEPISGNFFGQSSFATHALCHEANVVKVPRDVPLELLGPLGCGIQTGAGAVLNALKVAPGKSFCVFGAGAVGLSAVMAAKIAGAAIIVAIDVNEARLQLASELGATHTLNGAMVDAGAELMKITGYGVDYALDTTGAPTIIHGIIKGLAPRGACGIVGSPRPPATLTVDMLSFMVGGRKLMGIIEGSSTPSIFIPELIKLYQQGRFPIDRLVKYYAFADINQAMHDAEAGIAIKPIVRMG